MAAASASQWRAMQSALESVVLAWVFAEGDERTSQEAMLRSFISALDAAPAPQRTPLATTVARALPDSATSSLMLALLERTSGDSADAEQWDATETAAALCARLRPADRAVICAELMEEAADGPLLAAAALFAADVCAAPSAAPLRSEDEASVEAHAVLLQTCVVVLGEARAGARVDASADDCASDAGASDAREALESLVSGLRRRLPLADYLSALATVAEGEEEVLHACALELTADALLDGPAHTSHAAEALVGAGGAAAACLLRVACGLFVAERGAEAQGALLCADAIARAARAGAGAQQLEPELLEALSACLAPALDQASHERGRPAAVVASALAAAASLMAALGSEVTPSVPVLAKSVIAAADSAVKATVKSSNSGAEADAEAPLRLAAAYTALGSLVDSAGGMLSPYMPSVLRLLLHPVVSEAVGMEGVGAGVAQAASRASAALAALPVRVPARVLADPLAGACAAADGSRAAVAAAGLAAGFVKSLPQRDVGEYAADVFGAMRTLCVRAAAGELGGAVSAAEAAEAARATAVALVLRTSENVFRPLFHSAMRAAAEASRSESVRAAAGATADDDAAPDALMPCAETAALLGLSLDIAEALRGVFLPFQSRLLPHVLRMAEASASDGDAMPVFKKRRGGSEAAAGADVEATGAGAVEACRVLSLRLLSALCTHDTDGAVATGATLERVLDALVASVGPCAAVVEGEASGAADALVGAVGAVVRRMPEQLHSRFNRGLLTQARDGATAPVRRVALRCARALLDATKEEYLPMLAESVPILAEMLEDSDATVEAMTQDFIAELSSISGEDIKSFLR